MSRCLASFSREESRIVSKGSLVFSLLCPVDEYNENQSEVNSKTFPTYRSLFLLPELIWL